MAKNFSRELAERLLDKLSTDDHFREVFQRNPRAALAQLGHHTDRAEEGIPGQDPVMCLQGPLASKDEIRAARATLLDRLSGQVFHYEMSV